MARASSVSRPRGYKPYAYRELEEFHLKQLRQFLRFLYSEQPSVWRPFDMYDSIVQWKSQQDFTGGTVPDGDCLVFADRSDPGAVRMPAQ